jgi:hypothetical protein
MNEEEINIFPQKLENDEIFGNLDSTGYKHWRRFSFAMSVLNL